MPCLANNTKDHLANSSKKISIGIFGGTFDPPHNGHIAIAEQAIRQLSLDRVYFVPAYIPPHKFLRSSTTARQRITMVKLSIGGLKKIKVSSVELERRGVSYTIDTLRTFHKKYPSAELVLIIGADNLAQFDKWRSQRSILKLASLAVYRRKGFAILSNNDKISCAHLKGPMLLVSSTEVRQNINDGSSIKGLVPRPVYMYIQRHKLYSRSSKTGLKKYYNEIKRTH
jgi:nicotinate-nucleotide adenylyltransferase